MNDELYKALRDRELYALEGNESLHGKFVNHKAAEYGPLKGQTAIGNYALMPGTVEHILETSKNPGLEKYQDMDTADVVKEMKTNPSLQKALAESYYDEIYKKHPNDPEARAASWLMGPNRSDAKTHELMDRFPKIQEYVNNFNKHLPSDKKIEIMPKDLFKVPEQQEKPVPLELDAPTPIPEITTPSLRLSDLNQFDEDEQVPVDKFAGLHALMNLAQSRPERSYSDNQESLEKQYLNPFNEQDEDEEEA